MEKSVADRGNDGELIWHNIGMMPRVAEFPFRVSSVGWLHRGDAHYHGSHEGGLEFCFRLRSKEASAVDIFDGKAYRTRYPHVVVKRPGIKHDYDELAMREEFFFIYQPPVARLLELSGISLGEPVVRIGGLGRVARVVSYVRGEIFPRISERGAADEIDSICWHLLVMAAMLRRDRRGVAADFRSGAVNAGDAVAQKLRAAEERMRLGFPNRMDFDALARDAGMSRRTFFRHWFRVFRDTPQEHLRGLRLDSAARGLVQDSRSVAEVGASCGFPDAAYFCAVFKKRFGIPPMAYRSREREILGWGKRDPSE